MPIGAVNFPASNSDSRWYLESWTSFFLQTLVSSAYQIWRTAAPVDVRSPLSDFTSEVSATYQCCLKNRLKHPIRRDTLFVGVKEIHSRAAENGCRRAKQFGLQNYK